VRIHPDVPATPAISEIVENVVGCKWTLHVLEQVRAGVTRPGRLVRTAEGLTTKVLNERLAKLVRYGVLTKVSYPEIPPRVEYQLTPLGARLNGVLDAIASLQHDVDRGLVPPTTEPRVKPPRR
jgi:DNA-binding HxlR family transcriptional regulator